MAGINTTLQFKTALRLGAYAWPGGYPLFFICDDGGVICPKCARKEARSIMGAIRTTDRSGWRVVAQDINWEDSHLECEHCGGKIESAYGDE